MKSTTMKRIILVRDWSQKTNQICKLINSKPLQKKMSNWTADISAQILQNL